MAMRDFGATEGPDLIEADICIIGGGAAGISVARKLALANTKLKILLVESGGLTFDPDTQDLYKGPYTGRPYYELDASRLRFFGGSTNHWQGWCGPMDAMDFEKLDFIPNSGWPIALDDLLPHYREAHAYNELGPWAYDDASAWPLLGIGNPPIDPAKMTTYFWQFADSPVRYGEKFLQEKLEDKIDVLLMANGTALKLNAEGTRMESLTIRSLSGKRATVKARAYVLSCGGIGNARLLLANNDVQKNGIGNDRDLVGRYFMEHPHVPVGHILGPGLTEIMDFYNSFYVGKVKFQPAPQIPPALRRQMEISNVAIEIFPVEDPNAGLSALRRVRDAMGATNRDWSKIGSDLWKVLIDIDDVAWQAYRRLVLKRAATASFTALELIVRSEQTPNPDSRVTLIEERDALGMPRGSLNWQLTDQDNKPVKAVVDLLGAELARLGYGRIKLLDSVKDGNWMAEMIGGWHHMGTTRMSEDPSTGVVDRNCRIHGIDNLYVAGSSVFTTSGFVNPTLTIVALAYRLADHLKERLAA
jgi:choline dehydrogenase-like flavoprotein